MNFLPFVVSFLLLLVIGSTMVFNTGRSTQMVGSMITAKRSNLLALLSAQAAKKYKRTEPRKEPGNPDIKKKESDSKEFKPWRDLRQGYDDTKFNLWAIVTDDTSPAGKILYEKAVRLVENLYKEADFYKAAHDPLLAKKIVDHMCGKRAKSLLELFPAEEGLASVYYKMVQGTNTGYPSLGEFFKIDEVNKKIRFRYASTEVLRAIFGDELTQKILKSERAKYEVNPRDKVMEKEELKTLLQGSRYFDVNNLDVVFDFSLKKDGMPHIYVEPDAKIMAQK